MDRIPFAKLSRRERRWIGRPANWDMLSVEQQLQARQIIAEERARVVRFTRRMFSLIGGVLVCTAGVLLLLVYLGRH